MFAGVVVNQKANALNRLFYYQIPKDLPVQAGMVVEVPFGHRKLEAIVIELVEKVEIPLAKIKSMIRITNPVPLFGQDLLALSQFIAEYYLTNRIGVLQAMLPAGMHLTGKMPQAHKIRMVYPLQNLTAQPATKRQQEILTVLAQYPEGIALPEFLKTQHTTLQLIKKMEAEGYLELRETFLWDDHQQATTQKPVLTSEQKQAIAEIDRYFAAKESKPVLLYGVTGSGKTELYLDQVQKTIAQGKQAIILVPEIALTPQTVQVFQGRLGAKVAVLHSGLTGSERRKAWLGIAQGQYQVVIGARSAIFAPTPDLGLIIMDEEHETSYKQENAPRFHTRRVALERCRLTGANLLLGSATPDLASYYASQQGDYHCVKLLHRVGAQKLAKITLVDMRQELLAGNHSIFSQTLQQKLQENLVKGQQSLLFLNRRGFESFVSCRHCGHVVECPHCSVAMAYHLQEQVLKCHYCGQTLSPPKVCPKCGSAAIRYFGAGTQKIVEAAKKLLPAARIARLDRDSASQRGSYEKIYQQMRQGEVDVLVGTQMIAKGLDFPGVTLVGVVAADTTLNLPDYRSGERTFQLLTQVAGRAGRHQAGEVVIQTYRPGHTILQAVRRQDYETFYQQELAQRSLLNYPPFSYFIRIVLSGCSVEEVKQMAQLLAYYIGNDMAEENLGLPEAEQAVYWGPKPCPKEWVKDRYRLQIMLKSVDLPTIRRIVKSGLKQMEQQKINNHVQIAVDVEPLQML